MNPEDYQKEIGRLNEIVRALEKEIDGLKADLLFTRNEAIAVIRLKNEEITSLKRRRKP